MTAWLRAIPIVVGCQDRGQAAGPTGPKYLPSSLSAVHDYDRKQGGSLPLSIASVLIALAIAGCSSIHWGEQRSCAAPAATYAVSERPRHDLHIVSWNLHGTPYNGPMHARIDRVAAALAQRLPDVILFQEVWFEDDARLLAAALRKHYDAVPEDRGVRRGFLYLLAGLRSGGLLAFVRSGSGWVARESTFQSYRAQAPFWRLTEGDGLAAKGVQTLELHKDGLEVVIFHTHLQSQYGDARRYAEVRARQLEELERIVRGHGRGITLAAGDFNIAPEGDDLPLYASMVASWDDLTAKLRLDCQCRGTRLRAVDTPSGAGAAEVAWVDYAFARRAAPVQVMHAELIRNAGIDCPFSDHHGIELHLALGDRIAATVPAPLSR
jgi:endonuclease/exonuclease/phosphatase family metal-dependent hydrolase